MDTVPLGRSALRVPRMGVGTWSWGDRPYWGYERRHGPRDVVDAFAVCADAGLGFFDTAEVYGHGESEKILGWLCRKGLPGAVIATKFALLPGREGARSLQTALTYSLRRLGRDSVDLYQIHWPDASMASIPALMDAMAGAVHKGRVRAVGVSNFSASELREAHAALARHGIPLATQQVAYNLVHRAPETDGVLSACRELGVTLLAYSPIAQGLLAGTYGPENLPSGPRAQSAWFAPDNVAAVSSVVELLRRVGDSHGGRTPAQVALAWLMAQPGVVPLAGARNGMQATENLGALGWSLTADDLALLDAATERWRTPPQS